MKSLFSNFKDKLNKININRIFYNNKLVFFLSVVASFSIWITMNISGRDSEPVTISDIPISINLSESATQDGLRIFSGHNIKAQINISGNRLIVGQVTKDDILVTAQQASTAITSPGKYTLELTAKKTGLLSDYEFASGVQPSLVTVMVDRYREAEFNIEPEIDFSANPEYFLGATVLSSTKVTLSGPESEISKIKRVVAKGNINEELQSTYVAKLPIVMYDAYGEQIVSETISPTVNEVEVTIPVLMRKKLDIHPNFVNIPEGLNLSSGIVKVVPSSLEIVGPEEEINEMDSIELEPIDFCNVNIQHAKFDLQISLPSGCKSLNNVYIAGVHIDTSGFKEKILRVDNFSFVNVPEGKSVKAYTDGLDVKIVGPSYRVRYLDSDNIEAEVDLQGKDDLNGAMEAAVKIVVKGYNDVWASGQYLINIEVT